MTYKSHAWFLIGEGNIVGAILNSTYAKMIGFAAVVPDAPNLSLLGGTRCLCPPTVVSCPRVSLQSIPSPNAFDVGRTDARTSIAPTRMPT